MNSIFDISFFTNYFVSLFLSFALFLFFIHDVKVAKQHGVIADIAVSTLCLFSSGVVLVGMLASGVAALVLS